jgi:hypothetical protein
MAWTFRPHVQCTGAHFIQNSKKTNPAQHSHLPPAEVLAEEVQSVPEVTARLYCITCRSAYVVRSVCVWSSVVAFPPPHMLLHCYDLVARLFTFDNSTHHINTTVSGEVLMQSLIRFQKYNFGRDNMGGGPLYSGIACRENIQILLNYVCQFP